MWQSLEILNIFNALTLKQIFYQTKTFSDKLEHRVLVQSTTIKSATFPYKTALSKANDNTNREYKMDLLERATLFYWKFNFSVRASYK